MSPSDDDVEAALKRAPFHSPVADALIWLKRGETLGHWLNVWRRKLDVARRGKPEPASSADADAAAPFGARQKPTAGA